jgi:hypothetical protein
MNTMLIELGNLILLNNITPAFMAEGEQLLPRKVVL